MLRIIVGRIGGEAPPSFLPLGVEWLDDLDAVVQIKAKEMREAQDEAAATARLGGGR